MVRLAPEAEADWHAWRAEGIGGSEISAVVGLNPWSSPTALYLEKIGLGSPVVESRPMRLGKDLEDFLGEIFERETGLFLVGAQTRVEHPDLPWARATLDGYAAESRDGEPIGVVELKTVGEGRRAWTVELPDRVQCQVQWQLFVTGLLRAWVVVLGGDRGGLSYEIIPVDRDERAIAVLVEQGADFWRRVVDRDPPPADGSQSTTDALRDAYPTADKGTQVSLDHMVDVLDQYVAAEAEEKAAKARVTALRNRLVAVIGKAEEGTVDGEVAISYRMTMSRRIASSRMRDEAPDLYRQWLEPVYSRRFLLQPSYRKARAQ